MRNRLSVLAMASLIAAGCGSKAPDASKEATVQKAGKTPDVYRVKFETSKGDVVVEVHRDWAPFGADRFYELVQSHFFDDARFFRVLKGFVVQFGLNKAPEMNTKWHTMQMVDDPVKETNSRGTITYATGGPNTRTTQMFFNLADNRRLDADGFAPFGKVVEGMDVVDSLYGGYGEGAPNGAGPDQQSIETRGNAYLTDHYPKLDYIKTAVIAK
jgi:peptidyl-prolyl cis-trans isomerase A (cyclophilin A)